LLRDEHVVVTPGRNARPLTDLVRPRAVDPVDWLGRDVGVAVEVERDADGAPPVTVSVDLAQRGSA
jgi:hypothetical protein